MCTFHLSKGDIAYQRRCTSHFRFISKSIEKHFQGNKSQPADFSCSLLYPLIDFCLRKFKPLYLFYETLVEQVTRKKIALDIFLSSFK